MEEKLRALTDRVNQLARAYYVEDAPQVSDGEYDALFDQLLELEKEAGYSLPDSPTRRVGGEPLTAFLPHTHLGRLWSLDKVRTKDDLLAWGERVERLLAAAGAPKPDYALEYKFDGLTINLTYENGRLVAGATRGNGVVGEAILPQIMTIRSLPLTIPFAGKIFRIIAHGKALFPQKGQHFCLIRQGFPLDIPHIIASAIQMPAGSHLGVQITQGACGGVTGVFQRFRGLRVKIRQHR